jgi:hypothetical protein
MVSWGSEVNQKGLKGGTVVPEGAERGTVGGQSWFFDDIMHLLAQYGFQRGHLALGERRLMSL